MTLTTNTNFKINAAKAVLLGIAMTLNACTDPFHNPKFNDHETAPLATPTPEVVTRPACTDETVLQANIIDKNFRSNFTDATGLEIGDRLCTYNDKVSCRAEDVIRGVRMMALALKLDQKCIETFNCNTTDENRANLKNLFPSCYAINTMLMTNVAGLSPTGKTFNSSRGDKTAADYGYGGSIANLIPYKELCKDTHPEKFPPRDPETPPGRYLPRAIWMGVPIYFANLSNNPEKVAENERLKSDLNLLCETYKNRDKEEFCAKIDQDVLRKCKILNMNPDDVNL